MTHASAHVPLWQRTRPLTDAECEGIAWLPLMSPVEQTKARVAMRAATTEPGDFLCRIGKPPTLWFGEGTLLKREPYRYNIQALRRSTVAGLPIDTFHWLLENSIPFNRFVLNQLNERLGQFIAAREIDRLDDTDSRVARGLAAMFHPILFPGVGEVLRITQKELGYVVGLSRQRVNEALNALQQRGLIRIEYGGVRVLDLEGLRTAMFVSRESGRPDERQLH